MATHLHWDGAAGAAGDMLLASLVDAGADWAAVEAVLRQALPGEWSAAVERVARGGVAATYLTVHDPSEAAAPAHGRGHKHKHDHAHPHEHGHGHDHAHGGPHRHLADLLAAARHPAVPARARERAERVFRALAEAEGRVHGRPPDEVHFHEVSGIDTVVDVLGVCLALEQLDVERITAAPPFTGSGVVRCAHGFLPVPPPAVVELLRAHGLAHRPGGADKELLTPTGAALLTVLSRDNASASDPSGATRTPAGPPAWTAERVGYGAGRRELPDRPNVVRALLGRPATPPALSGASAPGAPGAPNALTGDAAPPLAGWLGDFVWVWESTVDDMTAEAVGYWMERTLEAGALDAWAAPVTMKKSRPGWRLTALVGDARLNAVSETLARETSTFGWRVRREARRILDRRIETVTIDGHAVRVKAGLWAGRVVRRQPEYEDCRAAARALGLPLAEVFRRAAASE